MNLNRTIRPDFNVVNKINIPIPEKIYLDNTIETYILRSDSQDVVKLEVAFNGGSWFQKKALAASFTNEMLLEGTKTYTSHQIAEKLDFYGAFIHNQPTKDYANITLYTLKKYLAETLHLLQEAIIFPVFPDEELKTFTNKRKQYFQVELEKVNNIARREFNAKLFGENHPYGVKAELSDYNHITKEDLVNFHRTHYHPNNCKIFISGNVSNKDIELINNILGSNTWANNSKTDFTPIKAITNNKLEYHIAKKDAKQAALRIGKRIIPKNHPDYQKLNIVNTLLGGYFGSRLMKTIREEKGYTYGINSALVSLKNDSYFVILSEVRSDISKNAVADILNEIKKLRTQEVSINELEIVKNYMLGHLLRSFDGIFEISSNIRNLIDLNLDLDYYNRSIETIKNINTTDIIEITNKYLHEESLVQVIVG